MVKVFIAAAILSFVCSMACYGICWLGMNSEDEVLGVTIFVGAFSWIFFVFYILFGG